MTESPARSGLRIWLRRGLLGLAAAFFVVVAGGLAWIATRPGLDDLAAHAGTEPTLLDASGEALILARGVTSEFVPLSALPEHLIDAVVALEDRRFHEHGGVDWRSVGRAFVTNVRSGEVVAGGSTITQQLIKISYLSPERTMRRKLHELKLAREMEARLSKDEILQLYLNRVYLGSGAHGVGAGARVYFARSASDLTLAQSAVIAATIRAPSVVNPYNDPDAVKARAGVVLDLMGEQGHIDAATANAARVELATMRFRRGAPPYDGWFADWIGPEARAIAEHLEGDVAFRTTLDLALQRVAEDAVRDVLSGSQMEGALVALRPDGTVAAMVGGRNYEESEFNRAVDAMRQPGSTFKLFVYLAALTAGYGPDDRIEDRPIDIDGYRPENFDGSYAGRVTLERAFARSLNAATVRLAMEVGIGRVAEVARRLGIEADLTETPSLALGTSEVSLIDLTEAYAAVATGRGPVEARGLAAVSTDGEAMRDLPWTEPEPDRATAEILAQREAMARMLRAVVTDGTGRGVADVPGAVGKTGTTQEHRDALFVGWNDQLIVGVWVGFDDNDPMQKVTGGSLPGEIWKRFLLAAANAADAAPPERLPEGGGEAVAVSEAPDPRPETTVRAVVETLGGAEASAAPACNIRACERHYRSFRASDCTFQPYGNRPRERCTK